jgi:hypothetical protein
MIERGLMDAEFNDIPSYVPEGMEDDKDKLE